MKGGSRDRHVRKVLVPLAGALACHGLSAGAQTPSPARSAVAAPPTIAGWDEKDGVLRIVVSARDPGVPNWIDTAGYSRGLIQGRWTDCESQPIPTVRKVPLADVLMQPS